MKIKSKMQFEINTEFEMRDDASEDEIKEGIVAWSAWHVLSVGWTTEGSAKIIGYIVER